MTKRSPNGDAGPRPESQPATDPRDAILARLHEPAETKQARVGLFRYLDEDPRHWELALKLAKVDLAWWINHFIWTYDPRDFTSPTRPFVLFPSQVKLLAWLDRIVAERQEGILEKSRDVGVSWLLSLYALHKWIYAPGFRTTFGSFKQEKVDRKGDSDSLFEKIRMALDGLPPEMLPVGYRRSEHDNYMRLLNPATGNQIIGEVGDQLGRGGRSSLFVLDEAAFVEHAKSAAKAISENADAKVWASTANGMANAFYLRREQTRLRDPSLIFRLHWRDDPRKDEAWAAKRKAEMEPEDWASEHEIDYGASTERQLIKAEWIDACKVLGRKMAPRGEVRAGLDVGAGKAESVIATAKGTTIIDLSWWKDPDAVDTASEAVDKARTLSAVLLQYDATGVGMAQGAIMGRMNGGMRIVGVNVGEPVPDVVRMNEGGKSIPASDRFANMKAYGWWCLREMAKASWELLTYVETMGTQGVDHPISDCLLLAVDDPVLNAQLAQPTWSKNLRGKRQVDKAPDGVRSPDRAEAVMLALLPDMGPRPIRRAKLLGI